MSLLTTGLHHVTIGTRSVLSECFEILGFWCDESINENLIKCIGNDFDQLNVSFYIEEIKLIALSIWIALHAYLASI